MLFKYCFKSFFVYFKIIGVCIFFAVSECIYIKKLLKINKILAIKLKIKRRAIESNS